MAEETTLVHETRNPKQITSSNPTTITQLKSQGYRVVPEGEAEPTGYHAQKAADLKVELDRRNEARDEETRIVPAGRKQSDLADALKADDAAQAEQPGGGE